MPTIITINGFIFHFYSSDWKEPIHIHIEKGDGNAKIWLEPKIKWAYCYGFKPAQKKQIVQLVNENIVMFKQKWHDHFNQK